jgi:hypothetical protein
VSNEEKPQVLVLESAAAGICDLTTYATCGLVLTVWSSPAPRLASYSSPEKLSRRSVSDVFGDLLHFCRRLMSSMPGQDQKQS